MILPTTGRRGAPVSPFLVARLHIDLCRVLSARCPRSLAR